MLIHFLPFQHIGAFCDLLSQEIFVSYDDVDENIKHELIHLISDDADHGMRFRTVAIDFGVRVSDQDMFSSMREQYCIPSYIAANIGNISGIQNILVDYHLLQAYRKFSQKTLATYGTWEVFGEGDGDATTQKIRLYPTPKGVFPVVVLYYPVVTHFRSPQAKKITCDMALAEAKCMVGMARRKIANMPSPAGGTLATDGDALVTEGNKEKEELTLKAIQLGEPMQIHVWGLLPFFMLMLIDSLKYMI